jgi:hypothetical protein
MAGFMNGMFIFTYEDAAGNEYTETQPFFFNVMGDDMWGGDGMWDDGMWGEDGMSVGNMDGEFDEEESGGFWLFTDMNLLKWAIIIGGGLLIIGGVSAIIIAVKLKKKKSDDDDDL